MNILNLVNFTFFVLACLLLVVYSVFFYMGVVPDEDLRDMPFFLLVMFFTAWIGILINNAFQNQARYGTPWLDD